MPVETSNIKDAVTSIAVERSKSLVPDLRFNEFVEDWTQTKYGEIFSFHPTNSLSRDALNYNSGKVKNIHYGDIHTKFSTTFCITDEDVPFINEEIDLSKIKEVSYCRVGDLVIADASEDYNDIGKTIELVNLNGEKVLAGLHTFLARPKNKILAIGFPGYLVQSWNIRKQVMTIAQGTKVLGIATRRLSKISLTLPTLSEQQKIASFLSNVDSKIQQLTQKKELLEQYKKGVMQRLFSQELRFKQEGGSEYPDWEEKNILDISSMKARIGWQNLRKEEHLDSGKYHLVTGTDFHMLKVNWTNTKYVEYERYIQDKHIILEEGDILITKDGSIGKLAFVENIEDKKVTLNNGIFRIRVKNDLPRFIFYTFLSRSFNQFMHQLSGGSSIKHLYQKDFETYQIEIPSFEEQNKIASCLNSLDEKIETVNQQLEKTQKFKKGLLQQMFVAA